jgi:hypothetical protein
MSEQQPSDGLDPDDTDGADARDVDPDEVGVDPHDTDKLAGLPPGASTKGDPHSTLRGSDREAAPYDEAPAQGRLAPGADNPPP